MPQLRNLIGKSHGFLLDFFRIFVFHFFIKAAGIAVSCGAFKFFYFGAIKNY